MKLREQTGYPAPSSSRVSTALLNKQILSEKEIGINGR